MTFFFQEMTHNCDCGHSQHKGIEQFDNMAGGRSGTSPAIFILINMNLTPYVRFWPQHLVILKKWRGLGRDNSESLALDLPWKVSHKSS